MTIKTTLFFVIGVLCSTGYSVAKRRDGKKVEPNSIMTCSECISASQHFKWCSMEDYNEPRCQYAASHYMPCTGFEVPKEESSRVMVLKAVPLKRNRPISPQKMKVDNIRFGESVKLSFEVKAQKKPLKLKFRHPRHVRLEIRATCVGFTFEKKTGSCMGISRDTEQFDVTIVLRKCLPKPKKMKVTVDGHKKKSLKVVLTSRCTCDCDHPSEAIIDSVKCSGRGAYKCGECQCNKGYFGRHCECHSGEIEQHDSLARCSINNTVCSYNGDCVCGMCECYAIRFGSAHRYSGRFCECNDYSCEYSNRKICGGPDRGVCRCGQCQCQEGYSGSACGIPAATDNCMAISGLLCDGHGQCINNRCLCDRGSYRRGPTCEDCPTCPGICERLKPCIECSIFNTGSLSAEECETQCRSKYDIHAVDDVSTLDIETYHMCIFRDMDNCVGKFAYSRESPRLIAKVQTTMECACPERGVVNSLRCGGRGTYRCGQCECNEGVTGRFCECDDASCPRSGGKLCGGPDRGVCRCGECQCQEGYTGSACDISSATDNCMALSGQLCDGHGKCMSNRCVCDRFSARMGPTCEECPTCPGICDRLKPCVECSIFSTGSLSRSECDNQCTSKYDINPVDDDVSKLDEDFHQCRFRDEDSCVLTFAYRRETPKLVVRVTQNRQCDCSEDGVVSSLRCNARGTYRCGQCECNEGATGRFCECDDASCPRSSGKLCGGAERGVCKCGECQCHEGYTGIACDISTATDDCMARSGLLCDGHGKCINNRCVCDQGDPYSQRRGPTCEDCPTCPGKCGKLKPCVQCTIWKSGSLSRRQCRRQCRKKYTIHRTKNISDQDEDSRLCRYLDEDNCVINFTYMYTIDAKVVIRVAGEKDCP